MFENKIGTLEKSLWYITPVILIVACIFDFCLPCFSRNYGFIFTIIYNLTVSCLAALIILYFQRKDKIKKLEDIYLNEISGNYIREKIVEPTSIHNERLQNENQGEVVTLSHLGGHLIKVETKYWSDDVEGIIEFSENSQFVGNGIYRYTGNTILDVGTYKVHRFPDKPGEFYVYYENTIPKNGASGYEVWIKQNENKS